MQTGGVAPLANLWNSIQYAYSPLTLSIPASSSSTFGLSVFCSSNDLIGYSIELLNGTNVINTTTGANAGGGTLILHANTNASYNILTARFNITRTGFDTYSFNRNYAVHSLSAGNTSLLSFLTTFKNDTTIPEIWKMVIASIIALVIMAFVGVALGGGELIAGIIGAVMLTLFAIMGWYNWILVTIAWVILVGYLMWRGGGGW
jgi:hypothetical protein